MAGRSGAQVRPGWALEPNLDPVDEQLRRRRWRVLRAALPQGRGVDNPPTWVKTPEQFVDWLSARLATPSLQGYFEDLELLARQTCDLELVRFARLYMKE